MVVVDVLRAFGPAVGNVVNDKFCSVVGKRVVFFRNGFLSVKEVNVSYYADITGVAVRADE